MDLKNYYLIYIMENNNINCFKMRMNLSAIPEDILPIIARYLLQFDNTYKFNKIFRKKMIINY